MKKIALIGLAALLINGCNEHKPKVTYSLTGGFVGFSHTIAIDEKQIMRKDLRFNREDNDIVYAPITKEEYKQLDYLLHDADFFALNDKYIPDHIIYDAINQSIEVTENDKTKNIYVETGVRVPKKLTAIIQYINKLENEKFPREKK